MFCSNDLITRKHVATNWFSIIEFNNDIITQMHIANWFSTIKKSPSYSQLLQHLWTSLPDNQWVINQIITEPPAVLERPTGRMFKLYFLLAAAAAALAVTGTSLAPECCPTKADWSTSMSRNCCASSLMPKRTSSSHPKPSTRGFGSQNTSIGGVFCLLLAGSLWHKGA